MGISFKYLMTALGMLSFMACSAQIKNSKAETIKIYGNCGMCKSTIEKAGNIKKVANVDWNQDTKMAVITYDTTKTTQGEILKRIALAGYDSDQFLAPDEVYANLHGCCQYERVNKTNTEIKTETHDHATHTVAPEKQDTHELQPVFERYFAVKDALVKSDGNTTSTKAKELLNAITTVKMDALTTAEHTIWMKTLEDIALDAEHISNTKDIAHQRDHFMNLSKNLYQVIKSSKSETPVYYQHCPMANDGKGANWLSQEGAIKNPYYGSQMLTCGKTVEIIK